MEEAERIARDEHGSSKIAVISGKFFECTACKTCTRKCTCTREMCTVVFSVDETETNYHQFISILLISLFVGVGTRNYYRKIGYELEGPYMCKSLEETN